MAKKYTFQYTTKGRDRPSHTVEAEDDTQAYTKILAFLAQEPGRALVRDSIYMVENRKVPDPPKLRLVKK